MTAQVREKLILDGVPVSLAFCPDIGIQLGHVTEATEATLRDKVDSGEWPRILHSTACWRRYIATWQIKDNRLYLNDVIGNYQKVKPDPVFAEWVTAVLRVPEGRCIKPVNGGFGSVYEAELHLRVESGIVVERHRIDNTTRV